MPTVPPSTAKKWSLQWPGVVLCCAMVLVSACGSPSYEAPGLNPSFSESPDAFVTPTLSTDELLPPLTEEAAILGAVPGLPVAETVQPHWHEFLHSASYAGALAVKFTDASGVTWDGREWGCEPTDTTLNIVAQNVATNDGPSRSRNARDNAQPVSSCADAVATLNAVRQQFQLSPQHALPLSPEIIDQARRRAAREGKHLTNWNRVVLLPAPGPAQAEMLLATLHALPITEWAHPMPVFVLSEPGGVGVPDLSGEQTYLSGTNSGLNITQPSKDFGLDGTGQLVIDAEGNWNYTHADLPLDIETSPIVTNLKGETIPFYPIEANDLASIAHGTAVVGIIAAKHNEFGVDGIAPAAMIQTAAVGTKVDVVDGVALGYPLFSTALNIVKDKIPAYVANEAIGGQVLIIEGGNPGPHTAEYVKKGIFKDITNCPGCLPAEAFNLDFASIQDLITMGLVVVEGAGNGAISLDDPEQQMTGCGAVPCPNLATDDSGALMVGASQGLFKLWAKHPASTCGQRVNVYAWGDGVVTTGYGNHPMSVKDDPNQWYTNTFGGTSAATAILGGMVALVQEYVDKLYAEQLEDWQHVYLNAAQVRALFTHPAASTPQSDGGCNIGRQPDLGKALQLLKDGVIKPTIVNQGGYCDNTVSNTCQTTCETDPFDPQANCGVVCEYDPGHKICADWCLAKHNEAAAYGSGKSFDLAEQCPNTFQPLAKPQDLDGDGRADLIAWGRTGSWHVDLSSVNSTQSADGFGAWDLTFTPTTVPGTGTDRLFPVVQDYNSDGQADLAIYNTDTGKWYIKWTGEALLAGAFGNWDQVLDYSTDPAWQPSSRPFAGDFEWNKGWMYHVLGPNAEGKYRIAQTVDMLLVTPNGAWNFDYRENSEGPAAMNQSIALLTAQHLAKAPGWAYLPTIFPEGIGIKTPDGIDNGERLYDNWGSLEVGETLDDFDEYPAVFGANATILVGAHYNDEAAGDPWLNVGLRHGELWQFFNIWDLVLEAPPPAIGWGGVECRPFAADYDGDGKDDRAVLCPKGEWRIAYTGTSFPVNTDGFRIVQLGTPFQALPGCIHPGGTDYQEIVDIYTYYNFGCPKDQTCTINDLKPPIGPYFTECLTFWANHPLSCLNY